MPLLQLKEVFTPLKWFGIKVYRDQQDHTLYLKVWRKPIKRLFA